MEVMFNKTNQGDKVSANGLHSCGNILLNRSECAKQTSPSCLQSATNWGYLYGDFLCIKQWILDIALLKDIIGELGATTCDGQPP
jgi:hypothetical protein